MTVKVPGWRAPSLRNILQTCVCNIAFWKIWFEVIPWFRLSSSTGLTLHPAKVVSLPAKHQLHTCFVTPLPTVTRLYDLLRKILLPSLLTALLQTLGLLLDPLKRSAGDQKCSQWHAAAIPLGWLWSQVGCQGQAPEAVCNSRSCRALSYYRCRPKARPPWAARCSGSVRTHSTLPLHNGFAPTLPGW